jgi:DNA adenine methylase
MNMERDPHYYDAKIAGWWCWGLCCWIGGGWCTPHGETKDGDRNEARPMLGQETKGCVGTFFNQTPALSDPTRGCVGSLRNKMPKDRPCASANGRPQLDDAFARGRGVHGNDNKITCEDRVAWLVEWFGKIRDRLRSVRVCCGDWLRVCDSPSVTTRLGLTGVFFDPPYGDSADRDMNLYAEESGKVAGDVRAYCLERGNDPMMRIVLAGYAGEGHEVLEQNGWTVIEWAAQGGYGNRSSKGKENAKKERLWYSPHCVREEANLFSEAA